MYASKKYETNFHVTPGHRWELPGNNPFFMKYGNLPLRLENHALLLLPLFFTTFYTYPFNNILYLGEPSGNII